YNTESGQATNFNPEAASIELAQKTATSCDVERSFFAIQNYAERQQAKIYYRKHMSLVSCELQQLNDMNFRSLAITCRLLEAFELKWAGPIGTFINWSKNMSLGWSSTESFLVQCKRLLNENEYLYQSTLLLFTSFSRSESDLVEGYVLSQIGLYETHSVREKGCRFHSVVLENGNMRRKMK
ncbi:hypothetical protein L9F63_000500, partial [Diploptera punctata]